MPEDRPECEVLVVGGGPAAGTAARLLSSWGRRVVVAARRDAGAPDLPVSLTPSCGKFFDLMGIRSAVDASPFVRSRGHTVWWGTDEVRRETFSEGVLGWQAGAGRIGDLLLSSAVAAGATVLDQGLTAAEVLAWPARFRLDCTGRTGVLARVLGSRHYEPGHRTVALVGLWEGASPAEADATHTLLESYADGWAWSIPVDDRRRAVAVMVDPKATALTRGDGAETTYRAEVAKTRHLAAIVGTAALTGGPWGWDASMYCAGRFAGDGWLLVGDAGSFVDPLSSAGVKKAMASGWLAAVTANTALERTVMTTPACELFSRRETETYRQFLAMTRQYMAEGAARAGTLHPFWADRADSPEGPTIAPEAEVRAAFERLKAADPARLSPGPGVRIEPRPALGKRLVTLEPHLVTDAWPHGVRHVLDVDVAGLVGLVREAIGIPDLHERYTRRHGPIGWPSFLTAVSTCVARKWLILG